MKRKIVNGISEFKMLVSTAVALSATQVVASTSDAPWVGMMNKIIGILVGPTGRGLIILAFIGVGLTLMFGNLEAGAKKGFQILLGGSIILLAASWGPKFFGYSGALLM